MAVLPSRQDLRTFLFDGAAEELGNVPIVAPAAADATTAQYVPVIYALAVGAFLLGAGAVHASSAGKVYERQTAPEPAWITTPVNADIAKQWGAINPARYINFVTPKQKQDPYAVLVEPRYPTPWPNFNPQVYPPLVQQAQATYILAEPRVAALRVASDKTYLQQTRPSDPPLFPLTTPATVDQTLPAFEQIGDYRTPKRAQDFYTLLEPRIPSPSLDFNPAGVVPSASLSRNASYAPPVRWNGTPYILQTDPEDVWQYTPVNASLAQTWPAVEETLRTYRTPDRKSDRLYLQQTSPELGWIFTEEDSAEESFFPTITQQAVASYRSADRAKLDVRGTSPNPGWLTGTFASIAQTYVGTDQDIYRQPERKLKPIDSAPTWPVYYNLATTTDQLLPAFEQVGATSYLPVARWNGVPYILQNRFLTPFSYFDLAVVMPGVNQIGGYRGSERVPAAPFYELLQTDPLDGWQYAPVTGTLAQFWPAQQFGLYRSPDRAAAAIQTAPTWPVPAPSTFDVTTTVAAIEQADSGYRLPDRDRGQRLGVLGTDPNDGWQYASVDLVASRYWPALEEELRSYRTPDRITDRTFLQQTTPEIAWLKAVVTEFEAYSYPPMGDEQRNASYLPPARSKDVRPTVPNDGWVEIDEDDPAIASWIPAFAQELSSFRTPDRRSDRTFILQGQPEPNFDTVVTTWEAYLNPSIEDAPRNSYLPTKRSVDVRPTTPNDGWVFKGAVDSFLAQAYPGLEEELRSFRLADRVSDKTYLQQTTPEIGWIFSEEDTVEESYFPTFDQELSSFRTPDRIVDRTYLQQTTPEPNYYSATTPFEASQGVGPIDAQRNNSYRSVARSIDVRPTTPNDGWQYTAVNAALAQFWPAIADQPSYRSLDRASDKTYLQQTVPEIAWLKAVVTEFEAYQFVPVADQQRSSFRSLPRPIDVRPTTPNDGWIYGPASAALAAQWPAVAETPSFRTPDRNTDKTYVQQTAPEPAWIYTQVANAAQATWPAIEAGIPRSYRAFDRLMLPIQTIPNQGWIFGEEDAVEESFFPAFLQELGSYRSPDRQQDRTFILQGQPEPVYKASVYLFEAAEFVPVADQQYSSYCSLARSTDVRPTTPNDGWQYGEEDAFEASLWPVFEQELRSYRTPDSSADRFFIEQTTPEPAWIYTPVSASLAQTWPAVETGTDRDFRTRDRFTDKTYLQQTDPNDGWQYRVTDSAIAPFWPAFEQELRSYRTPDSKADRYFIEQTYPQVAWYISSITVFDPTKIMPPVDAQERNGSYLPKLRSTDVRPTTPNDGWQYKVADGITAKYAPVWDAQRNPYRSLARLMAPIPTSPLDGWQTAAFSPVIARYIAPIDLEASSFRTLDRRTDKTFLQQTAPEIAWLFTPLNLADVTTTVAALYQERNGSYRPPARSTDVRPTVPNDGWVSAPVKASLAAYWPAQTLPSSYRQGDRYFDVLRLQTQPQRVFETGQRFGQGSCSGTASTTGNGSYQIFGSGAASGTAITSGTASVIVYADGAASGQAATSGTATVLVFGSGSCSGTAETTGYGFNNSARQVYTVVNVAASFTMHLPSDASFQMSLPGSHSFNMTGPADADFEMSLGKDVAFTINLPKDMEF